MNTKDSIESTRMIWKGVDGKITGGFLRPIANLKEVEYAPLQIRTFLLTSA